MPTEPSTRRDRDGLGRPFRLQRTEEPRLGRGTEHHVHRALALAQPLGEPEQRSRSVATPDKRARHRLLRQLERATERADHVDRVVRLQALHPAGAGAVRGEHDLDGAAVDARRPDPVDREGATQQRAGRLTADRERHEVARPGPLGDAVGDDRQVLVVTDPLDREHLATDLERSTLGARGDGGRVGQGHSAPSGSGSCRLQLCNDRTSRLPARSASMPCTVAPRPCTVVMHGMLVATHAVRIS